MEKEKLIKYSLHLSMLKVLYDKREITEEEYGMILKKIQHDFGVITHVETVVAIQRVKS